MLKYPRNFEVQTDDVIEEYISKTDELLKELHESLWDRDRIIKRMTSNPQDNPFMNGDSLREAIFYAGETAFRHQYLIFSAERYKPDNNWIFENKGFIIEHAVQIVAAIQCITLAKTNIMLRQQEYPEIKSLIKNTIDCFVFTPEEIMEITEYNKEIIENFLSEFSISENECNSAFNEIGAFNLFNAKPIIKKDNVGYISFLEYSLAEAIYESPHYWMLSDRAYFNTANKNRCDFTESFCYRKFLPIFGSENIFQNVVIMKAKKTAGEIDVLIVFGDRAIIIQAKSKKLTLESRKGNEAVLKKDFQQAIHDAYRQGESCAKLLLDPSVTLSINGHPLNVSKKITEIFILCAISENYPALTWQSRIFLGDIKKNGAVFPPVIFDVFTIDVMTEFLSNPLLILSYLHRRAIYFNSIISSNEIAILSYHLKKNLWIDDKNTKMIIDDTISVDIDVAMEVRNGIVDGAAVPSGILTYLQGTLLGKILDKISYTPKKEYIDVGYFLLSNSGSANLAINEKLTEIQNRYIKDKKPHNIVSYNNEASAGITFHINDRGEDFGKLQLARHCNEKINAFGARKWYGIHLSPNPLAVISCISMNSVGLLANEDTDVLFQKCVIRQDKPSRNAKCPCGSGKKYKKCCERKVTQ